MIVQNMHRVRIEEVSQFVHFTLLNFSACASAYACLMFEMFKQQETKRFLAAAHI